VIEAKSASGIIATRKYSPVNRKKLAFVHTSHVLIPLFSKLAKEVIPDFEVFHTTDESLIRNTIAAQQLTKSTIRRLVSAIESAHEGGAAAVMVTCSSIGPGVEVARMLFDFPVLRVDEPMAKVAVNTGRRVGVAATLRTTLDPTIALIEQTAATERRDIEIVPSLAEGAFEAVVAGDTERHDTLLIDALNALRDKVDVVVLAQASMARVLDRIPVDGGPPILSSPELAVRKAREVLINASEPIIAL
jgi:Asp/Glu/hydantoin racemase